MKITRELRPIQCDECKARSILHPSRKYYEISFGTADIQYLCEDCLEELAWMTKSMISGINIGGKDENKRG